MSPKQITRLGLIVGVVSLIGLIPMIFLSATLGWLRWWPAVGLGLALLLFIAAYGKGAYLAAQRRADLVDMLNDCYTGTTGKSGEVR